MLETDARAMYVKEVPTCILCMVCMFSFLFWVEEAEMTTLIGTSQKTHPTHKQPPLVHAYISRSSQSITSVPIGTVTQDSLELAAAGSQLPSARLRHFDRPSIAIRHKHVPSVGVVTQRLVLNLPFEGIFWELST